MKTVKPNTPNLSGTALRAFARESASLLHELKAATDGAPLTDARAQVLVDAWQAAAARLNLPEKLAQRLDRLAAAYRTNAAQNPAAAATDVRLASLKVGNAVRAAKKAARAAQAQQPKAAPSIRPRPNAQWQPDRARSPERDKATPKTSISNRKK